MNLISLAESAWLPDGVIRYGIRRLLRKRIEKSAASQESLASFADMLRESPLAIETDAANRQHYECPTEFYRISLGEHLKYSCCLFEDPKTDSDALATLDKAEAAMLSLTCERAELGDGMQILELGCGWGSLTLWMAQHYPNSQITAVSNSGTQREFIESRASELGLTNVTVIKADMRDFAAEEKYDRIVSVEMFEHMRNYELLFERIESWLAPLGKVLVHVFCYEGAPYLFEAEGEDNWMGEHFFTGGIMPTVDLFAQFSRDLSIAQQWRVNGMHYWKTCEAWLQKLDASGDAGLDVFRRDLSSRDAKIMRQRWRMFFMACAELFRYGGGKDWFVMHYLMESTHQAQRQASGASSLHDTQGQPA